MADPGPPLAAAGARCAGVPWASCSDREQLGRGRRARAWNEPFADLRRTDARPTTDDRRPTTDDRRPTTDDRRPTTDDRQPPTGDWSFVGSSSMVVIVGDTGTHV
jgi:hypothetical protein